jgi:hypothetical protein
MFVIRFSLFPAAAHRKINRRSANGLPGTTTEGILSALAFGSKSPPSAALARLKALMVPETWI